MFGLSVNIVAKYRSDVHLLYYIMISIINVHIRTCIVEKLLKRVLILRLANLEVTFTH